jgi:hypothetical protein
MRLPRESNRLSFFFWACASILWTYMAVTVFNLYRSWYITTACVCFVTVFLLCAGVLKTRGLAKGTGVLLIYYLYLLLTATWAEYPSVTIWYVATESIFIFVFSLFYLLSMNFKPDRIIDFFVNLVPAAIIIFLGTYIKDPEATRLGGYVLVLLPFVLFFCTLRLIQSSSFQNVAFVTACLLMLVISMSRTPLLIAGMGLLLIFVKITTGWRARRKFVEVLLIIGVLVVVTILAVPQLELYTARALARITYQDVVVGDQLIEAEMSDAVRWTIFADALSLYETNWLLGMGYMNFMPWYGDLYNFSFENARGEETVGMNLHNTFQTWALEGGLPCIAMVTFLLWKYFRILRKRISQSNNEPEKAYYKLFVIGMICLLWAGLFQQIHQTPVFFAFLGIVYALDENGGSSTGFRVGRVRALRAKNRSRSSLTAPTNAVP